MWLHCCQTDSFFQFSSKYVCNVVKLAISTNLVQKVVTMLNFCNIVSKFYQFGLKYLCNVVNLTISSSLARNVIAMLPNWQIPAIWVKMCVTMLLNLQFLTIWFEMSPNWRFFEINLKCDRNVAKLAISPNLAWNWQFLII